MVNDSDNDSCSPDTDAVQLYEVSSSALSMYENRNVLV